MFNLKAVLDDSFIIKDIRFVGMIIYANIDSNSMSNKCPKCSAVSSRIHSSYSRTLYDLPISEYKLLISLRSKKFFCDNNDCEQKVFTERYPGFIKPYARRTNRLENIIKHFAFLLSAEMAALLSTKCMASISADTMIRIIRKDNVSSPSSYETIGVDEFAFRKGQSYGTLICDHKTRKPIDVLPDKSVDTFKTWIEEHKGIKFVSRDRASWFAKAISVFLPRINVRELLYLHDRLQVC